MTSTTERRVVTTSWWGLGVGTAIYLLAFFTPWAVVVSVALLAAVAYRLTRRPAKTERTLLIIAAAVLLLTVAAFLIGGLVAFNLQSTHTGVSTPM